MPCSQDLFIKVVAALRSRRSLCSALLCIFSGKDFAAAVALGPSPASECVLKNPSETDSDGKISDNFNEIIGKSESHPIFANCLLESKYCWL